MGTHPPHASLSSCAGSDAQYAFLPTSLCFCILGPLQLSSDPSSSSKLSLIPSLELPQQTLLAPCFPA